MTPKEAIAYISTLPKEASVYVSVIMLETRNYNIYNKQFAGDFKPKQLFIDEEPMKPYFKDALKDTFNA